MTFEALDRLAGLRERLRAAVAGRTAATPAGGAAARPAEVAGEAPAGPADVFVTQCEVNDRHGTGVLLQRLFGGVPGNVSVRSLDLYAGEQAFGALRLRLSHGDAPRPLVYARVLEELGGLAVRRILCVPFDLDATRTAMALHDLTGAPLCSWVMDDQNIEAEGVPDEAMRALLERSALRLAISPELRRAYQEKFRLAFALAPPVVGTAHLLRVPAQPEPARLAERRGLVFGNIWGERWLANLLQLLEGSGVTLDWHSGAGTPWMEIDRERLARAGLQVRPYLPEPELVATLRACPYVVVPSGDFSGDDPHRFVARLSLPSRLPYLAATAGTPVLVLGHPETAAARFVARHGLGVVAPYRQEAFRSAVEALCRPEAQARHRAAAAALAPALSAEGATDWIWRSLEAGGPIDGRFERLEKGE